MPDKLFPSSSLDLSSCVMPLTLIPNSLIDIVETLLSILAKTSADGCMPSVTDNSINFSSLQTLTLATSAISASATNLGKIFCDSTSLLLNSTMISPSLTPAMAAGLSAVRP